MNINWEVRVKNPLWWAEVILAIMLPIVAYMGITLADLTTWGAFGEALVTAIKNPYVLMLVIVSVWNAINDPTTAGVNDGEVAHTYVTPSCPEQNVTIEIIEDNNKK